MRKNNYLVLDKKKEEKDITSLILHCLFDADKIRSIKFSAKGKGVKVWIYHKISLEELNKYDMKYKKEIEKIKEFMKN